MRSRLQTSRPLAALLFASVAASALAIAGPAMALPRGGEVVAASSGDGASISSSGNTMTIDQFSQKVVIDWASFNIGSSETVNFNQGGANFVAFNRIGSAQVTSINGAINAQGGVWLFAPGGLLFGKNAAVNVGSFVASTARLQNPEDVVNGNSISAPSNDGPTSLEVAKGAVINANNGFALLHSENLDQRGDVTASGSVAYVISEGFNLQYQGGTSGIQLVSFTPTSPSGGKPLAFNHTGATTAGGSVGILAPASAATPGFEGVINLGGIVQADAIGTGGVGLLINVGADAQGSTAPRLTLDASRGQIFTNGSASIAAWSLRLGDLSSGDLIANALTSLTLDGDVSVLGDANVTAGIFGDIAINDSLEASGSVNIIGGSLSLGRNAVVRADSDGADGSTEALSVFTFGDIDGHPESLLVTGNVEGSPEAPIVIRAGTITEGGIFPADVTLGEVVGGLVTIDAFSHAGSGGDITLGGRVYGAGGVVVQNGTLDSGPNGGNITILEDIDSLGSVTVTNNDGGDVVIGEGVTIQSDLLGSGAGDISIFADRDVVADATSLLQAGSSPNIGTGNVTVHAGLGSGGDLTLGRAVGFNVVLTAASGATRNGDITALGSISAARVLSLIAQGGVTIGSATLRGDADGDGDGIVEIDAQLDIEAAADSLLVTGLSGGDPTATILVRAGAENEGALAPANIALGGVRGDQVFVLATGGGDITLAGPMFAVNTLLVQTGTTGQTNTGGTISVLGEISGNAAVALSNFDSGSIVLGAGSSIRSDADGDGFGDLVLIAQGDVTGAPDSSLFAGSTDGPSSAGVFVTGGVSEGGGNVILGSASGGTVSIAALGSGEVGDVTTHGLLSATNEVSVSGGGDGVLAAIQSGGTVDINLGGALALNGPITAAGALSVTAGLDVTLGEEANLRSDSDGDGEGALSLIAGGDVVGSATSLLMAGSEEGDPTAAVTVVAGSGSAAGGDITVGSVRGTTITLQSAAGDQSAGDITALGALESVESLAITGAGAGSFNGITSGGRIDIALQGPLNVTSGMAADSGITLAASEIGIGAETVIRADADGDGDSGLTITARGSLIAASSSLLVAGSVEGAPSAAVTLRAGAPGEQSSLLGGDLTVGNVRGQRVDMLALGRSGEGQGNVTVTGLIEARSVYIASGTYSFDDSAGNIDIQGSIDASEGVVLINFGSGDILVGPESVIRADNDGSGDGYIAIDADGDVTAAASSLLAVGSSEAQPTGYIDIVARGRYIGSGWAGDANLQIGRASAGDILLETYGNAEGFGLITVAGDLSAAGDVEMFAGLGTGHGGGISILADVTAGGYVGLESTGGVAIGAGSSVYGGQGLAVLAGGTLTVEEEASLTGGSGEGGPEDQAWPFVTLSAEGGGVLLQAADIDLRGAIASTAGEDRGDIFIRIVGDSAAAIGGEGPSSSEAGFNLSNAEFQRLSGRNIVVGAPGDLTVGDLMLDAANVSALWLGAGGESRLTVAGSVQGTGASPVDLHLGFLAGVSGGHDQAALEVTGDYVPGEIAILGSLGGDGALGLVSMVARGDILMGSEEYVEAAAENEAFDPSTQIFTPPSQGHLFVQAEGLQLAAGGRILQQNTGGQFDYAGLVFGLPSEERPLIVTFEFLQGDQPSPLGPTLIDIHGVITGGPQGDITGRDAADVDHLLLAEIAAIEDYKINDCSFGLSAACAGDSAPVFQNPIDLIASQTTQSSEAVEGAIQTFLSVPDHEEEEERDAIGLPVTGSGNEDLWTGVARDGAE